jgi:hypothetical protein
LPVRAIDAEPSTIRSPKNPLEPRNGRKVGDPWPTQQIGSFGRNSEKNSVINAQRVDWTSNDLTK